MHSLNMVGVGALGEVLTSGNALSPGNQYAFTFDTNKLINLVADTDVKNNLQYFMQNFGDVISLTRPFFSGRYVVVVVPKAQYTLNDWLTAFSYAWSNMPGFEQVTYDTAETGSTSSMPGGLPGLVLGTKEQVINPLLPDTSSLLLYLALVGIGVIGLSMVIPALQGRRY